MTDRRPSTTDQFLVAWFEDGPTAMPDRVVDVVADRIGRQRQRRSWRLPWRLPMNTQLKLAASLAAIVVLGVVGYSLLPRIAYGPGGQPSPSPAPAVTPTPTLPPASVAPSDRFVCEEGTGCAGFLTEGAHRTAQFAPPFGYTTPTGWMNPIDITSLVGITPVDRPADLILVWSGVRPAEHTATCTLQAKPGAGSTVDDWIAFLDAHPGLDASNIRSITIGTSAAKSVDIRSYGGWRSPCADDRADYNVPLLSNDGAPGDGYGVRTGAEARVYAIAVGDKTIVVTVYSYGGSAEAFQTAISLAEPVVTSFDFATP